MKTPELGIYNLWFLLNCIKLNYFYFTLLSLDGIYGYLYKLFINLMSMAEQ